MPIGNDDDTAVDRVPDLDLGQMSVADAVLACLWVGLTAYALLAGADFGAGAWDLVAGGATPGARQRDLIEHSIGPVWEANHARSSPPLRTPTWRPTSTVPTSAMIMELTSRNPVFATPARP